MNMEMGTNSKRRRLVVYIGLSALMLTALACLCGPLSNLPGVGEIGGAPTPTLITLDGGSTDGGSTDGGSTDGGNGFTFVDPTKSGLKSYRSKFTMTFTGTKEDGTPDNGTFTMEQAHTSDPPATSFQMTGEGSAFESAKTGTTQMFQIGDATYIITPVDGEDKCVSMSSSATGGGLTDTTAYSPDMFLSGGDMSGAKRILPDEVVNGILSQHWQFTKDSVALLTQNWESYTVDAWVAVDGGYATKSVFVGDGEDVSSGGGKGHVEWEFNLLEANTDITITVPEGCEEPVGSDFPKMADATDAIAMAGFSSYTTASSVADVVAFYQAQLPPLGWTAGEANSEGTFASLKFTKDGQTADITITEADGKTTVLIQIQ